MYTILLNIQESNFQAALDRLSADSESTELKLGTSYGYPLPFYDSSLQEMKYMKRMQQIFESMPSRIDTLNLSGLFAFYSDMNERIDRYAAPAQALGNYLSGTPHMHFKSYTQPLDEGRRLVYLFGLLRPHVKIIKLKHLRLDGLSLSNLKRLKGYLPHIREVHLTGDEVNRMSKAKLDGLYDIFANASAVVLDSCIGGILTEKMMYLKLQPYQKPKRDQQDMKAISVFKDDFCAVNKQARRLPADVIHQTFTHLPKYGNFPDPSQLDYGVNEVVQASAQRLENLSEPVQEVMHTKTSSCGPLDLLLYFVSFSFSMLAAFSLFLPPRHQDGKLEQDLNFFKVFLASMATFNGVCVYVSLFSQSGQFMLSEFDSIYKDETKYGFFSDPVCELNSDGTYDLDASDPVNVGSTVEIDTLEKGVSKMKIV